MSKHILVVDDEPDIVTTVAMALELEGYKVRTAVNGSEAMEQIRSFAPDLVIIDMVLPEISGQEVVRWMKESPEYRHIPVILITALAQKSEKEAFSKDVIDCCLIKPFDLNQLEKKVKDLLSGKVSSARP